MPLKYSLLDTSGTSPSSSSATSSSTLPKRWILSRPLPLLERARGRSAVGAPQVAKTRRRSLPSGRLAPVAPCALGC
jgi:hypothetical protein